MSPQRESILGRHIQGALGRTRSRNSVPEVQEYLATQAEIDASSVDAGYTLLRAFIWAVPILGFIGTVMGISTQSANCRRLSLLVLKLAMRSMVSRQGWRLRSTRR